MVITFVRMKNVLENYQFMVGRQSLCVSQVTHQAGAYPGICSIKRLALLIIPLDGILIHRRALPHPPHPSPPPPPPAVTSPVPFIHLGVERNWLIDQAKLKLSGILYNRVLKKIIVRQNSVEYAATIFVSLFSWGTNRAAKEMYNQSRKLFH